MIKASNILIFSALAVIFSCNSTPENSKNSDSKEVVKILTTNYPLYCFVEEMAGDYAEVIFPAPPGSDPAFYDPTEEEIAEFQQYDLVISNGAGYEHWMENVSFPSSNLVNTSKVFSDQYIETDDGPKHSHGLEGEHSHGGTAFTTWLDLDLAGLQLKECKKALVDKFPDHSDKIELKHDSLQLIIKQLQGRLYHAFEGLASYQLAASHPVYQYLQRSINKMIFSFHWEPDVYPPQEEWYMMEMLMASSSNFLILWEGEPIEKTKSKMKEYGMEYIVFDPGAQNRADQTFFEVMESNIEALNQIAELNPDWQRLQ